MVVKMMRWRPWPPLLSKKFEVRLVVRRLDGYNPVDADAEKERGVAGLAVEIRWKGPKISLSSFRRTVKRNFTKEEVVGPNGVVEWDEEFQSVCNLSGYKDNVFHPWEIAFTVLNGLNQGPKNKVPVVGTASLNLAEFASKAEEKDFELNIPLISGGAAEPRPSLCISLSLFELRTSQEPAETVQRSIVPVSSPPRSGDTLSTERDELSALKAGLRKVKILTDYVSTRRAKKACREEEGSEGRCSARSEDGDGTYPFDSDSLDEFEEGESDEGKEDSSVRKSFSYGTLASANYAGGSFYSNMRINCEDEDLIYYSNRKSDVGSSHKEDLTASVSEPSLLQSSKRSILPWRKRKLSFRSPKAKGEPLLKKDYGEEGGDDIDFDRRQLSSDESLSFGWHKTDDDSSANRSSVSEFGDDNFAIGSWEQKEVTSRDGHMKLQTQVFFASIDQRSERAAGESACTALVAVIADWFQNNHDLMPIKSQFDSLIREGSLEWRNLCENETYRERFPDKHFDLETVLQAKIRPLSVVPGKSFIGFFHPDGMEEGRFDFLHGAMSFDNIWDEISRVGAECSSNGEPQVFIVSWNDHFFVLKVEPEAYYIIDSLGERLYEGCNQAYILKFDRNTTIYKLPNAMQSSEEKPAGDQQIVPGTVEPKNRQAQQINPKEGSVEGPGVTKPEESMKGVEEEEVVCQGKESCKEYIKSFLAAIPIRELQVDIKKGLMASTPLHHRLQIEFHHTQLQQPPAPQIPATEAATATPQVVEVAITDDAV
uniref:Putative F26K24.5 protein n=1 Tax=Davidia involucrata TaxID=16924 RepID=A0A5B7AAB2_DAVIN